MFIYLNKKGQTTLEYAVIIAVIVAALLAMQVYFKRGVQGRIRQASDDIGRAYSPQRTATTTTTTTTVSNVENRDPITGQVITTNDQSQNVGITETIASESQEVWPK